MPHYDDNERWLPDGKSHHLDRKAKRLRLHPVLHLSQHCMINVMHIWQAWCIFDKYDAFFQNFSLQIYNWVDTFHSCPICVTFDWLSIRAWPVCIRRTSRDSVLWCHPRQYSVQPWKIIISKHFKMPLQCIVHSDHLGEPLHIVNAERRNG